MTKNDPGTPQNLDKEITYSCPPGMETESRGEIQTMKCLEDPSNTTLRFFCNV